MLDLCHEEDARADVDMNLVVIRSKNLLNNQVE
jgi:ribonuclease PH